MAFKLTFISNETEFEMLDVDEDTVSVSLRPIPRDKYPAKLHARGVAKRLNINAGLIYLVGRPHLEYDDSDQPVYFRQRRYFYYLSGLNIAGCAVAYDVRLDKLTAWIQPPNSGFNVIFNGSNPTVEQIKQDYDFSDVQLVNDIDDFVYDYIHREPDAKIYLLHRPISNELFGRVAGRCDFSSLQRAMDAARSTKTTYELDAIRKANAITAQAHINVLKAIKTLENESEIEAIFAASCTSLQAKEQAYGIIASAGANASTLHYIANNEPLKGRQLVCLDAGCEWKCYASDVTRTFPISGKWTTEAKAIYDIVAKMQEECISMIRPGANFREIHMHAHKVALAGLIELGLLHNGSFDELYAAGATVAFFPHGLGHYLGLEVHDVGNNGNLLFAFRSQHRDWSAAYSEMLSTADAGTAAASILAPNQVITVEPGLYFNHYALEKVWLPDKMIGKFINRDLLHKYYQVGGVRIEDDILVTETGWDNLTTTPKGQEALAIINGEDGPKKGRRWFW